MKRNCFKPIVFLILSLVAASALSAMVIEKIIAKVNGLRITSSMVNDELRMVRYTLSQQVKTPQEIEESMPIQRAMIIDRLIEDKVILDAARSRKYDIQEDQIVLEVNKQIDLAKKRFGDERDFFKELKKEGKTLADLKKDYRKEITDELLRQKIVRDEVTSKIDASDDKVKEYYRQKFYRVRARHILVKTKAEATKLYYQLKDGADFEELAKKHSIDPSAGNGGDLGYFARGVMIPSFEEAAFSLAKGEFSEPVQTPFGYHLIKVEDIEKPQEIKPLSREELKALRKEYRAKELRFRYDAWIKDLKEKAVVEIMDESLKK